MKLKCRLVLWFGSSLALPATAAPINQCGRVSAVLEHLSAQSGELLKSVAPLDSHVVYMRSDHRSERELTTCLAQLLIGEWQDKDGFRELVRLKRDAVQSAHEELWLQWLRKRMDDVNRELLRLPPPTGRAKGVVDDYIQRMSGDQSVSSSSGILHEPANTLAKRIVIAIGAETLSRLPLGKTTVFSTKPTLNHRPLPDVSKAIQEFSETCEQQFRFMQDVIPPEGSQSWWNRELSRIKTHTAVDTVDLYAYKRATSLWVGIGIYSPSGALISQGGLVWDYLMQKNGIEFEIPSDKFAELDQDAFDHWKFCKRFPNELIPITRAPVGLVQKLLNPEKFDPLSFEVRAALDALHEVTGLDIVAVLDDRLLKMAMDLVRDGRISVRDFLLHATRLGMSFKENDGILLIRPLDLYVTEQVRSPRSALARLINQASTRRVVDVFDMASFVAECPFGIGSAEIEMALVTAAVVGADAKVLSELRYISPRFLRLIGSLTLDQKIAMRQGQPVSFAGLSPRQAELLYEFTSQHPICGERENEEIPDLLLSGKRCMPFGIPTGAVLHPTFTTDPIVEIVEGGPANGYTATPTDLAAIADHRVRTEGAHSLEQALEGRFRMGVRWRLEFTINLPPGVIFKENATVGFDFLSEARPVSFAALPQTFRDQVAAEYAKRRI